MLVEGDVVDQEFEDEEIDKLIEKHYAGYHTKE
jgi:hypothetical protein